MSHIERIRDFSESTVDLLITRKCQMDCVCFRPPECESLEGLSLREWGRVIDSCHSAGIRQIVFSGGEPLLFDDLPALLRRTKTLGLRTTLSTNALLFKEKHQDIMPYVDDIGIPLDGPTPEINGLMRPPVELNQFQKAIEAIQIVQKCYPSVDLTVRTVVSTLNKKAVVAIPEMLERKGIEPGSYRWKICQFNPAVSELLKSRADKLSISIEEFLEVWSNIRQWSTGLPHRYNFSPVLAQEENNFLVYPNGEAAVLEPAVRYIRMGNLTTNFDEVMAKWRRV